MRILLVGVLLQAAQEDGGQLVRGLVEQLKSEKVDERDRATREILRLGRDARPYLDTAARSVDPELRARALHLLRAIDIAETLTPDLRKVMAGVEARLASQDGRVWFDVLLEACEKHAASLRPQDLEALAGPALRAARGLSDLQKVCGIVEERGLRSAVPELRILLKGTDSDARHTAIQTLTKLTAREAWPNLVRLLETGSESDSEQAAASLRTLQASEAIPEVTRLLRDREASLRFRCVQLLDHLHQTVPDPDPKGMAEIARLLDDAAGEVRHAAVTALGNLNAIGTVNRIAELLRDPIPVVRGESCTALERMGARTFAGGIRALLEDPEPMVRAKAARALGALRMTDDAELLKARLRDPQPEVRAAAAHGLASLGSKEACGAIAELAKDPAFWVRGPAVAALGTLQSRESVQQIIAALSDEHHPVRAAAVEALGKLRMKEALPALRDCLKLPKSAIRDDVIEVLAGMEDRESIPAFVELLSDPERRVRIEAAAWLCHFGSKEGVPVLLQESERLVFLNALRRPDLWRKLRAEPRLEDVPGTGKDMLDATAKKAGWRLEWSQDSFGSRRWIVGRRGPRTGEQPTLLQVLMDYACSQVESVLDTDRISILSTREALAFWQKWWEGEKAR